MNYVLGLTRLGHDVLYVEDTGRWSYDPVDRTFVESGERNAAFLAQRSPPLIRGSPTGGSCATRRGIEFGMSWPTGRRVLRDGRPLPPHLGLLLDARRVPRGWPAGLHRQRPDVYAGVGAGVPGRAGGRGGAGPDRHAAASRRVLHVRGERRRGRLSDPAQVCSIGYRRASPSSSTSSCDGGCQSMPGVAC